MYYSGMANVLLCSLVIPEMTRSFFFFSFFCDHGHQYSCGYLLGTAPVSLYLINSIAIVYLVSSSQLKQLHQPTCTVLLVSTLITTLLSMLLTSFLFDT